MIRMRVVSVEALYLLRSYIAKGKKKGKQNKNISYILDWYQWLITHFLQSRVRTQTHLVESQKSRKSFVRKREKIKVKKPYTTGTHKESYSASTTTTRQSSFLRDPRRDRHKNPKTLFFPPPERNMYMEEELYGKVTQVDERNVPIYDATEMKGEGLINQKKMNREFTSRFWCRCFMPGSTRGSNFRFLVRTKKHKRW